MTWETHPVTPDRFEDFADVVNKNRRVTHCWCTSHRLTAAEINELGDGSREQAMRALCERDHPPGVTQHLIEGAVEYAATNGAPAVEAHPVDPPGRMDLTMAFVGTKTMFDKAGFEVAGTTKATASGLPRLVMRRQLR